MSFFSKLGRGVKTFFTSKLLRQVLGRVLEDLVETALDKALDKATEPDGTINAKTLKVAFRAEATKQIKAAKNSV